MLIYFHTRLSAMARPFVVTLAIAGMLSLQFFGSANGQELIRHLGDITDHYQEHVAADPSLSISDFFALHFGDLQQQHQSEHDHSDLPFQDGHHHSLVISGFLLALPEVHLFPAIPGREVHMSGQGKDPSWITSELTYEIWQPPRAV
ncbi:MAG TPA: hypothetical protein P5563_08200 [Saprospiraceae bacterium]|nr:hypothetical protein [Saprospiraceae bacterium]